MGSNDSENTNGDVDDVTGGQVSGYPSDNDRCEGDRGQDGLSAGWDVVWDGVRVVSGLDHELIAEWLPDAGPVPGIVAAYERARAGLELVRETLTAAGLDLDDFPGLCAGLDVRGRPVVVLGPVSDQTARRLLDGPSRNPARAADGRAADAPPDDGHAA